ENKHLVVMNQPRSQLTNQPTNQSMNQYINQHINQSINTNIPVNLSFDKLSAQQKYKVLTTGTDPFIKTQKIENQTVQLSEFIFLGTSFQ
ncbi:23_t:CDS:1, partial [Scutellospora calospora]